MEKATFAAGCFWGVEEAFRRIEGVSAMAVGYMGGHLAGPTYEQVCTGATGHAEVVQVEYDPTQVGYERLLEVFWDSHDPTTVDRQGPDVGAQYRSAIFYHSSDQQRTAIAAQKQLQDSGRFQSPIVTEISAASEFYRAEEYHQQYLQKRGRPSCSDG